MSRILNSLKSFAKRFSLILIIGLLLVLCFSVLILSIRFENFASRVGGSGVEAGQAMENLRQSVVMLSKDAQEMRELMRLPSHEYPVSKVSSTVLEQENAENANPNEQFFKGLDYLKIAGQKSHSQELLQKIKTDSVVANALASFGLKIRTLGDGEAEFTRGQSPIFNLSISQKTGDLTISGYGLGEIPFPKPQSASSFAEVLRQSAKKIIDLSVELGPKMKVIEDLHTSPPIRGLVQRRIINIDETKVLDTGINRALRRSDGSRLMVLGFDYQSKKFFIDKTYFASQAEFLAQVASSIEAADLRTAKDVLVDKNRDLLKNLSKDQGFSKFASDQGLTLAQSERSDSDYYYFDVANRDGVLVGSFAVQKWEGSLWLMDPRDIPLSRLDSLDFSKLLDQKKN